VHILVFEIGLSGHHANYLERTVGLFLARGHRVTIGVSDVHINDPVFARLQADHPLGARVRALPPVTPLLGQLHRLGVPGSELKHWLLFRRFFSLVNASDPVDRAFFPYLDYCLHTTAWLGPPSGQIPWAGICMGPCFHHAEAGIASPPVRQRAIKEALFYRLLRLPQLTALYTIDPWLLPHVTQKHSELASRLRYLPDPSELASHVDRVTARSMLGISEADFVVLVYGTIDSRKGVDLLLKGVRDGLLSDKVRVLVVGRQTAALSEMLDQDPLVTAVNRFVDTALEAAAFSAADTVWLGYRSHYVMSGVLVLAAQAGKPVIATSQGLIGKMVTHNALGAAIDCTDPKQVALALLSAISQGACQPTAGMVRIKETHTWDEANRIISQSFLSEQAVVQSS
jgi:glycosyltransferase involved in cell wall biosynthesis